MGDLADAGGLGGVRSRESATGHPCSGMGPSETHEAPGEHAGCGDARGSRNRPKEEEHSMRYQLSFTSGALFLSAGPEAARAYEALGDWPAVRAHLIRNNLLRARSSATATRWAREVVQRLQTLQGPELSLMADSTADELSQLMWIAACRRYDLVGEFAEEVVRERFLLMQREVLPEHFDSFFSAKSLWHNELTSLKDSTVTKLRSNLFAMLREASLINGAGAIIPALIGARVRSLINQRVPSDVRFFPARESL